jgi:hypothetical protein
MQNLPVYLYSNTLDVTLDLDTEIRGVNQVMYQRDLKIQKGIKNNVRIQFKNSDQKKIRIFNTQTFIFSLFDAINQRLLIEKPLNILDAATTATKGLALLTLTESDTVDLTRTSYQYSIKLKDTDGTYLPAYSNTYYGMAGTLHLSNEIFPVLQDSTTISNFTKRYNDNISLYEHISGPAYSEPEFNSNNNALHTVALYMRAFKGSVAIQVTLDNSPNLNGNFKTLITKNYNGFTGIDYANFNGIYSYIRIIFTPAKNPIEPNNDNPAYYGNFDKALYRS